jgi:hypothetical protein
VFGECDPRIGIRAPCRARFLAFAEGRRRRRPGLAVAGKAVGPELGAARDQRREIRDCLNGPGLGDADEPVRIEVVAEQERGVVVCRREEPRRAVVQEVTLVDRLEAEGVPLLGER